MFLKDLLSSLRLDLFDQKYSKTVKLCHDQCTRKKKNQTGDYIIGKNSPNWINKSLKISDN